MCPYIFYIFPLGATKQLVLELIPSYEQVIRACSLELVAAVAAAAAVQVLQDTVVCSSKTAATATAETAGGRDVNVRGTMFFPFHSFHHGFIKLCP